MEAPADIYSLAKEVLRGLVQRQPVCFTHSASLFDDLRASHLQRRQVPIVYESLLREVRDSIVDCLTVRAKCRTLQLAAIRAAPKSLWSWPATGSDSPRHHRRLVAFLLPLVMREVIRGMALLPEPITDR